MSHFGNQTGAPQVLLFTADAASRAPRSICFTGCSRKASAAVAQSVAFLDVLVFTKDSPAARAPAPGLSERPVLLSTTLNLSSAWGVPLDREKLGFLHFVRLQSNTAPCALSPYFL